jgi:hypothetical protein
VKAAGYQPGPRPRPGQQARETERLLGRQVSSNGERERTNVFPAHSIMRSSGAHCWRADILLTSRTGTAQNYLPGNDSRIRGRRMFAALELVFLLSDINQSLPTWNAQKTWDELRTFLGGGKGFWSESCV